MSVAWRNGFRSEKPGEAGYAHLCEHMLFEGSKMIPRGHYHSAVHRLGGASGAQTRPDFTVFNLCCQPQRLPALLRQEADRFLRPLFDGTALHDQLQIIRNEIHEKTRAWPPVTEDWAFAPRALFTDFAHSHDGWGDVVDILNATPDSLRSFHSRAYRLDQAAIAVVGPHRFEDVYDALPAELTSEPPAQRDPAAPCAVLAPRTVRYPGTRNALVWAVPGRGRSMLSPVDTVVMSRLLADRLHRLEGDVQVRFGIFDDPLESADPLYLSISWPSASAFRESDLMAVLEKPGMPDTEGIAPLRGRSGQHQFLDEIRTASNPRALAQRLAARTLLGNGPTPSQELLDALRKPLPRAIRQASLRLVETPCGRLIGAEGTTA
ncbi:insulinase family protein [Streptomyces sp. NBC_01288]|nr:insulinase family protein [Streptomyces sp. NBC_01288]